MASEATRSTMPGQAERKPPVQSRRGGWPRFVWIFLGVFLGGVALGGLFILLVDPYDVVPSRCR